MPSVGHRTIAVLTGDLVGHLKAGRERSETAMETLTATCREIATWTQQHSSRFTRFRGDGWQIYLNQPRLSLRAAVVIQGRLMAKSMESRISIGLGTAESLGTSSLADAAGKAFEASGQGLDAMGDSWRLHIGGDGILVQDMLIADLIGERMGRWTSAQAEAASMQLVPQLRTLFDIGRELNISPQAVNDRVRGAGCHTIASVLRRWEKVAGNSNWEATDA